MIEAYKQSRNTTTSNEGILLMLLESALVRQELALKDMRAGEWRRARERLTPVRSIFAELYAALDHEVAPEVTSRVGAIYNWIMRDLARVVRERDPDGLEGIMKVTRHLHSTWTEAVESAA